MAAIFTSSCFQILLIATIILSSSIFAHATGPFNKIYAFGDSFTDTGNTRTLAKDLGGFSHVSNPPYGSTFFHHPTNRFSDGRLVIDFIAEKFLLPFLPPYLYLKGNAAIGVNFAVGGCTAISHDFFVKNNMTLNVVPQSIGTQIGWFNQILAKQGCKGSVNSSPACKAALENSLIWFGEIGVNDYAYSALSSVSKETIQKLVIGAVTKALKEILSKGVKNVVVQGLPPTGCLPLALAMSPSNDRDEMGCEKNSNIQIKVHNTALLAELQQLRKQFPTAKIIYLDYYNAYATVLKNPGAFGFREPFKVCCGSGNPPYNFNYFATCGLPNVQACPNPAQYINWDGVHLTEAMYNVLAHMFVNGGFAQPPFSVLVGK
ncbi:GDSL esterase/lipase At3g48460-like [Mercurialis annua]|uniref:GDSL esterase/lipase At3g48460-like n=1 Tax=Mercurialis annua TaxID=3986 RepID=UPI002160986A|nr:GDSL esterase/lipase At3g48460-like [Mercurialis annua]